MNAAGVQETHRRRSTNMASAESAGLRVRATFSVATGPKSQVTGANTRLNANSLVFARRFRPFG
jgi:hypothetical protein